MIALLVLGAVVIAPGALTAAPHQQGPVASAANLHLPVIARASGDVTLHSHWADISLTPGAGESLTLALEARYRVRNDDKTDAVAELRIDLPQVGTIALAADGQSLPLQQAEDGAYTAALPVPTDGQVELVLTYGADVTAGLLPAIEYPLDAIDGWPGQTSLQINLLPDDTIPPAAWLQVAPAEWRYAPPEVTAGTGLQWLYDGNLPDAILFQFIRPDIAQQLAQATGDSVDALRVRGALSARLAAAAQGSKNDVLAERFYGQAIAALAAALEQLASSGAAAPVTGPLHADLAALYRERVVQPDGSTDPAYAELMVAEAAAALPGIMADDPRRAELERWQADGLRLLVADARRRGDVAGALALIDRLAAEPAGAASDSFLANERRALVVQQALALLAAGDRAAALALAGDAITDPALQPPAELVNLFDRWRITANVADDGVKLTADLWPEADQRDTAQAQLDELVATWQAAPATRSLPVELQTTATDEPGASILRLTLDLPAGATGAALAAELPARGDWSLLRVLLSQLGPKIDIKPDGLRQQVSMAQPIDLRSAGNQWRTLAESLEQDAAALESQASSTSSEDSATLEASLRARIQAANYRHAAQQWRDLAQDSQVLVALYTANGLADAARTWQITLTSPPQMLSVQVEALHTGRLLLVAAGAALALLLLAALLWRLL